MAKSLGYQVATNTTIYKETDMQEVEQMFDYLSDLGVDGHTISPGYEYDAAKKDMIKRLNLRPENFFLTRKMTVEKFSKIEEWMNRYTFLGTPVYFEFLAGKRDLTCSAWAIPTRNIRGWKGPCYLMTDGHYSSYAELLEKTEWDKYGVVNGIARDSRCENCMVHCGYEPTASLGLQAQRGDTWKTIRFNFGPKPKPTGRGSETVVFNGVSSGNGHITGKSAQTNGAAAHASSDRHAESVEEPDRFAKRTARSHRILFCDRSRDRPRDCSRAGKPFAATETRWPLVWRAHRR
jgi:hypothetical protein